MKATRLVQLLDEAVNLLQEHQEAFAMKMMTILISR